MKGILEAINKNERIKEFSIRENVRDTFEIERVNDVVNTFKNNWMYIPSLDKEHWQFNR